MPAPSGRLIRETASAPDNGCVTTCPAPGSQAHAPGRDRGRYASALRGATPRRGPRPPARLCFRVVCAAQPANSCGAYSRIAKAEATSRAAQTRLRTPSDSMACARTQSRFGHPTRWSSCWPPQHRASCPAWPLAVSRDCGPAKSSPWTGGMSGWRSAPSRSHTANPGVPAHAWRR